MSLKMNDIKKVCMKPARVLGVFVILAPLANVSSVQANTSVTLLDNGALRVVDYSGKPPFKRITISQNSNPELFAHYQNLVNYDPQPLYASKGRGAPGKSLPKQRIKVSGDVSEVAEFARFEEEAGKRGDSRRWRGAPGKSLK